MAGRYKAGGTFDIASDTFVVKRPIPVLSSERTGEKVRWVDGYVCDKISSNEEIAIAEEDIPLKSN